MILLGGFLWRSALGAPPRAKNCERCHFQLFLLLAIFRHPYFVWALSNEQFWINIKQDIKWISGQGQTFNGDDFKNIDEAIGIQAGPSEQKEIWANIALRLSRHKNLYFNFMFSTLSTSLFTYMSTTSHNKGCSYETRKKQEHFVICTYISSVGINVRRSFGKIHTKTTPVVPSAQISITL